MERKPFLEPRLIGARFDEHAIPLEFLKDFAVLEDMVAEVARWRFIKENPRRERVPPGFSKGIEIKLVGVEEGSAKLVFAMFITATGSFLPVNQTYYEQARESIIHAITAADHNALITNHMPQKALGYFDILGRSLREGETLELHIDPQLEPARLTKETRRKLVMASSSEDITEEISIRGLIPEANQLSMTFQLQLSDGSKATSPITAQHMDTVLEAFAGYRKESHVLLQGIGKFSRSGKLKSIETVEDLYILDPLDVPTRIEELRSLRDGWLEGEGIAPKESGLDWLSSAFEKWYPDDLTLPHLYPTAEGGIQAEWSRKPYEISLEIDIEQHLGEWQSLDLESDAIESRSLNLNEKEAWEWICDQLRQAGAIA